MLVFGYHFDLADLTEKEQKELSRFYEWRSSYSVGKHQPSDGVFGILISQESCLFNPLSLQSLRNIATQYESDALKRIWNSVPQEIQAKAKNLTPVVFIFENSDD